LQEPFLCTAAPREQRELLLSIIAWAARWESQRKSDRLRAKVATKRARSAALGQRARWGRGTVATWAEVATVHELRTQGLSVRQIAAQTDIPKSQVGRIVASVPPGRSVESENSAEASAGALGPPDMDLRRL
jgi:DNA invertase Pin-like site-specific DNA recombinase